MKNYLLLLLTLCSSLSCYRQAAPNLNPIQQEPYQAEKSTLTFSLFDFKEATLSEEAIQQILSSDIQIPESIRLAILSHNSRSSYNYSYSYRSSEGYLKLQQTYIDLLKSNLESNEQIEKIILMPKLIVGNQASIFTLRESAVRLQADLLFIFSINSDIYYDYKFLKKNEVKAFATCEALLMDIRTGIIPYSEIVSKDTMLIKENEDMNDELFRKRAENEAIQMTLNEIGKRLNDYLN